MKISVSYNVESADRSLDHRIDVLTTYGREGSQTLEVIRLTGGQRVCGVVIRSRR